MGGVNGDFLDESVDVRYPALEGGSAATANALVSKLDRPWIAGEGPTSVAFRRHLGGELELEPRGLAFDEHATVQWDEDAVWVIEPRAAEAGVLARRSDVLVCERLRGTPREVGRIDYLRRGVLIASRYLPGPQGEHDA